MEEYLHANIYMARGMGKNGLSLAESNIVIGFFFLFTPSLTLRILPLLPVGRKVISTSTMQYLARWIRKEKEATSLF